MIRVGILALIILGAAGCEHISQQQSTSTFKPILRAPVYGAAADALLLNQLRKEGSDLNKPTDVRFYLYIPGKADAKRAATTLSRDGFHVLVHEPLGDLGDGTYESRYSVIANRLQTPSPQTLARDRRLFESLASAYRGEYDGWEAQVAQ